MLRLCIFVKVLQFLDQDFCPSSCCCGRCVAFSVQSALCYVKEVLGPSHTNGVTAGAVRQYIKGNGIGCVGTLVRFRGSKRQVHAAHIQHGWFRSEDIALLHESTFSHRVSFFDVEEVFCFYYNIILLKLHFYIN